MRRLLAGLVLATALLAGCSSDPVNGVVEDKGFQPGGCSTGVGVSPKDGTPVVVNSCWGDSWTLVVREDTGEVTTVDVDKATYVRLNAGDRYDETAD